MKVVYTNQFLESLERLPESAWGALRDLNAKIKAGEITVADFRRVNEEMTPAQRAAVEAKAREVLAEHRRRVSEGRD